MNSQPIFADNCPTCHGSGILKTWSRNIAIADKCGACRGTGRQTRPTGPHAQIRIDHETGLIHGLPNGPQPLVGPTTGSEYQELKKKEALNKQNELAIRRRMLSTWQCTECKRKFPGRDPRLPRPATPPSRYYATDLRVKWRKTEGVNVETLVCPDQRCDGPVIMVEDAMSLTHVPGGRL
jgi:ribosomal protein L37AE/L43A